MRITQTLSINTYRILTLKPTNSDKCLFLCLREYPSFTGKA